MDKIAFIIGETFIYWNSIILTLGVAVAICIFLAFYLWKSGNGIAAALAVPLAIAASVVLSRLADWYFRATAYESMKQAMTDFTTGNYALMGVFSGCFLAACVLRLLRIHKNLPQMLDAMSLGGAAGIAVGRLACLYSSADRGMVLEGITELPFAYMVVDPVTGAVSYRLATFMLQSMVTGFIFLILATVFIVGNARKKLPDGDVTLLFLLFHGAAQAILDSTRYDSLFMRSNGFIGIVQVLGAVAVVLVAVVFWVRLIKRRGWKLWYPAIWLLQLGCLGGAGYMEYYVQRHGDQAAFAYSVMGACLLGMVLITVLIRVLAGKKVHRAKFINNVAQG